MTNMPLMPKATAVWLVDNTSLTFDQIAAFCGLHVLEVKGIADGDVAQGIKGMDPVAAGQLSRKEIDKGQKDSSYRLKILESKIKIPEIKRKKTPRYTPLSRRQDRPAAISWLLRNHPELTEAQISRLVGTTKPTITAIRERTHWNSAAIQPADPVALGLCQQTDLDAMVAKAAARVARERKRAAEEAAASGTLLSPEEALAVADTPPVPEKAVATLLSAEEVQKHKEATESAATFANFEDKKATDDGKPEEKEYNADAVFARFEDKKKPDSI